MREAFYRFCGRAQGIIYPGLRHAQYAYRDVLKAHVTDNSRWLDLGCGHKLLPPWMPDAEAQEAALLHRSELIVGVDYDHASLQTHKSIPRRAVADVHSLPFQSDSFDLLTANFVVEHLHNPAQCLTQAHRVLRERGLLIFQTTNLLHPLVMLARLTPPAIKEKVIWLLGGRPTKDVFPTYYRINTPRAITSLARLAGFQVVEINLVNSIPMTTMLGPLVVIELLFLRLLALPLFRAFRSNMIAILRKSAA